MTFAELYSRLDQTNQTNKKIALIAEFFQKADEKDKLWALALFTGKRPKKHITSGMLREWAAEASGYPMWLFEESYQVVGDLAETIALILPSSTVEHGMSLSEWLQHIELLGQLSVDEKKDLIMQLWQQMQSHEILLFNKLLTGGFRIGVSSTLIVKGLAKATGLDSNKLTHRIMGVWQPANTTFQDLIFGENAYDDISKPYPFYLSYPIEDLANLSDTHAWMAEWKWDGIRAQIIKRNDVFFVWSRGEELITEKFPELMPLAKALPNGVVIDGELMCHSGKQPLPFQLLQTRISRKTITKKQLTEAPAVLMAYDLLEWQGADIRDTPLSQRRQILTQLVQELNLNTLLLSQPLHFTNIDELIKLHQDAPTYMAEGLMLKKLDSHYGVGRKKGDWWKWKVSPKTIDGVLIYAQKGHGRRADLYTDYTFGVWHEGKLVTFTKAYSGLTDAEIKEVDAFIKKNTLEKFGPVRTVKPELVFEIAFEGISRSNRHKSGVALRFPRINRWRKDKKAEDADTLETLQQLVID